MMAALFVQAQSNSLVTKPAAGLSIPAELTKTVRADKAHRGDPVEFTTLEAILIGQNVVMPAQTKLFGRIVGAAPRQGDKPSWLVLLVEKAEWKQHSVPLHAFISGQITLALPSNQNNSSRDAPPATGNRRRKSGRTGGETGAVPSLERFPQDETAGPQDQVVAKLATLQDVRIVRDKDGTSYLVSTKTNVKLPGGTRFMLQNLSPTAPDQSTASGPR
jgi:hypothetical protein